MRSATAGARPLSAIISSRTVLHSSLSSLSMAEQMGRNLAAGTPAMSSTASSSPLWFSLMVNSPMGREDSTSDTTVMTSASGIMGAAIGEQER